MLLSLCVLALGLTAARADIIIDFQSLEVNDSGYHSQGFTYSEDGFTLDNLSSPFPFATFGTGEFRYPGSTAMFNDTVLGITRLTKTGGGAFDLLSIDLCQLNFTSGTVDVTFVGEFDGGGTISQTVTIAVQGTFALQTFNLVGFTNLVNVQWEQTPNFHQFDNIRIGDGVAVPVPSSIVLMGIGSLGMIGYSLRRKKLPADC
ncbi:MAG: PEP-CTERM sorting domain-containing protein [Planctomycetia bacterium]|nr:PEP-CTERM sorting domain-containing protein [Planctomycetia bacterium]